MTMAEILDNPLLTADYRQAPGVYDEMCMETGVLRPYWDRYIASLTSLGGKELAHRWKTARQRIRENGVSYNVYGDPLGTDRPWSLDVIPLLISPEEWAYLEAGLIQRARLLNTILADLYGPQRLLLNGDLPSALVFANPAFWRACHDVPVPGLTTCICSLSIWRVRPMGNGGSSPTARRRPPAPATRSKTVS